MLSFSYVLYLDPEMNNAQELAKMLQERIALLTAPASDSLYVGLFPGDSIFSALYHKLNESRKADGRDNSFAVHLCSFFHSLDAVLDTGHPLWSDLYAATFHGLHASGHCEAYANSLAQINATSETERWVRLNQVKVQEMRSWIESHQPPQKMNQILFGGRSTFK